MRRVDIVNVEEFDTSFWFHDGAFWGKDDQVDIRLLLKRGERTEVSIREWLPKPDADLDALEDAVYRGNSGWSEVYPFLQDG